MTVRGSSVQDATQQQDFALIRTGVSPELYQEALKEGEKAKEELDRLRKDQSLSATAKRILAEAVEIRQGALLDRGMILNFSD